MNNTPYFNYNLPQPNDVADISKVNANFTNLDAYLHRAIGEGYANEQTLDERVQTLEENPATLSQKAINSFNDGIDSIFKEVVSTIVPVQEGTGTPSPSNVRQINGYTECTVTNCGKNLISNGTGDGYVNNYYLNADNTLTQGTGWYVSEYFKIDATKTYTWSSQGTANRPAICYYDENKTFISGESANEQLPRVLSIPQNTVYMRCTQDETTVKFQVEQGLRATSYEPYKSTTATISLGDTIYSGSVDLINGILTIDRAYIQPTAVTDVATSSGKIYWIISNTLSSVNGVNGLMSSHFEPASGVVEGHCYITGNGVILVAVPTDQTLNTTVLANAWLSTNQPQFVYQLATPQSYQLTSTQLRSLVDANNLTSDTGEVIEVEYITNETIAWLLDLIKGGTL